MNATKTRPKDKPPSASALTDLESEERVLGCMMLTDMAAEQALANLSASDFHDHQHAALFAALQAYYAKWPQFIFERFSKQLQSSGDLDRIGGAAKLGKVIEGVANTAHLPYFIAQVRRASCLRTFQAAGQELLRQVEQSDPDETPEVLAARMEHVLFEATATSAKPESISTSKDMIFDTLERINERCKHGRGEGIPTGFTELDKMTSGLHKGQLIVLAARTGCGKSVLATNIARNVAGHGQPVFFVSLEMAAGEIAERLLLAESDVNGYRMRNGWLNEGERQALVEASSVLAKLPIVVDDASSRTVQQIASAARLVRRKHGLSVLIVDYLQLVDAENGRDSRVEQVAKVSRRLKTLARELQVPVIALAQLNRQADATEVPRLSHLRECGSIEQDADAVLFIHRAVTPMGAPEDVEDVSLIVAKQRAGPVGKVTLRFFRHHTRFENAAEKWQERAEGEQF